MDRYETEYRHLLKWLRVQEEMIKVFMTEGYTKKEAIELLKLMALQKNR